MNETQTDYSVDRNDPLQRPLALPCGAVLKNRIAKGGTTEGLADERLRATERHVRLYRRWAEGGAGLLITGNVQIDRRVLERPGNVAIDGNGGESQLKAWAEAGTVDDTHLWMQISHAGRQCPVYITRTPLAPSPVRLDVLSSYGEPRALEPEEIEDFIVRFALAAEIARETGFTGVQVHSAHGYLVSEFLSPVVNRRQDEWGGSLENRARFLLEAVRAVRKAVGDDFPVSVKLNSADFQKGGFTNDECLQVVQWLNETNIDLLEISGGTYEQPALLGYQGRDETAAPPSSAAGRESTQRREAYFLEYAENVRRVARMPLMLTGGFRSRTAMEQALAGGAVDVIGMARPLCVDTQVPLKLFEGTLDEGPRSEDYLRVGSGRFGLGSSWFTMKILNIFGQMGWYYFQLYRMGEGKEPDLSKGALGGLLWHLWNEMRWAWRTRKFRAEVPSTRRPQART